MNEPNYLDLMKRRLDGKEKYTPFYLGAKSKVREIGYLMGVKTPRIYFSGKLSEVPWQDLPTEFVFKPSFASTSIGIFLLTKEGDNFKDAVHGKPVTKEQIINKAKSVSSRYFDGNEDGGTYIIEELLRDLDGTVPPKDVRVNAFFGEIGMIYYDDHLSDKVATASYFDGNFEPFYDIEDRYGIAEQAKSGQRITQAERPENADLIINISKRISLAIPCAFIRIDFYNTPKGVYLGEITFTPGAFYYRNVKLMHEKEALRLGRMWARAEQRLSEYGVVDTR